MPIFRKSTPDPEKLTIAARLEQAKRQLDDKARIQALGYEAQVRSRDLKAKGQE